MDENRDQYHEAKEIWLDEISLILKRLSKYDPGMAKIEPKKTIMRINNNRMFHPDKPVYKDNFAFSPGSKDDPAFYVHISTSESFIGGGVHHPDNDTLKKIRAAIDYDGEELKEIIHKKSFVDFYGGLSEDPDKLKTSPRGYDEDHKHIELLRRKNFTAITTVTQKDVISNEFIDLVEKAYVEIMPLIAYMKKAMSVEA